MHLLIENLSRSWSTLLSTSLDISSNLIGHLVDYTKDCLSEFIRAALIYILICGLFYIAIFKLKWPIFVSEFLENPRRVLIVIAHPDDECMFFGPTILHLLQSCNCLVYLMCLSTGENYGMGKIRKNELYKACSILGIDPSCIIIQRHSKLPDAMDIKWPTELLSHMILDQIEKYDIDTIVTFDKYGVSRHINHCSIYYAVAYLSIEKNLPKDCKVYVLETVNPLRKYWLFLDIPISYILSRYRFIINFDDRGILINAMKQHKSQLLWFRYLYIKFSRYLMINTLQKMDLQDIELELTVDD